jgi:tetratricopeptide (TPR) repeat protein
MDKYNLKNQAKITMQNGKGSNQSLPTKMMKRPLSLVFIFIYGAIYLIAQALSAVRTIDFMDFLYGFLLVTMFFCIPLLFLFFGLYIKNLKVCRKRKIGFGTASLAFVVIIILIVFSTSLVKDQFTRAQNNFSEKSYGIAIRYYDYAISNSKNPDIIETAKVNREIALEKISEAESFEKKGDVYFEHGLYGRAEENYIKAHDIYPRLGSIKKKIKQSFIMKEKYGESAGGETFILFNENLKFKYTAGFPEQWGTVKICEPQLAIFTDFIIERGKFFESEDELKVSGMLTGKPELGKYVESEQGLFVFISAYVIDINGNIKWSKDGYLNGESPYIKENQAKDFSFVNKLSSSLDARDKLIIIAYVHSSMVLPLDPESTEGPDAERNVFAIYQGKI